ncbi:hypothetical protein SDC9_205618 [bioreactor metagenome]|uniref:Uncharacterized protein n=1 Tax=bioreactor metagenome TaxID=1076179 RepID=A0A645J481_9ZZZZ
MQRRDVTREGTVQFLRKRRIAVVGTKASLDVAHGNPMVKRRKRPGKGGGGVAVDEDEIGLCLV